MKKTLIVAIGLFSITTFAQTDQELYGRMGINTLKPKASLDVTEKNDLPETNAQGVSFPNFSTSRREKFTNVKIGTMIFNTDKKCLEIYMGVIGSTHHWNCLTSSTPQQQSITIEPAGFEGTFIQGVALNQNNKVKFKLINNSFSPVTNVDFSTAVSITNETANITIPANQNRYINLASGQEIILSYTMSGIPEKGTLTANFNRLSLSATQNTQVGMGNATINDKIYYIGSVVHNGIEHQGIINNDTHKITIKIPYTDGMGSYSGFTQTINVLGQNNDQNTLTLTIPPGTYNRSGNLTAEITVGGADTEFMIRMLSVMEQETLGRFFIDMDGIRFNVNLITIGAVLDKEYNDGQKNMYIPIEGPDGKVWLNNNIRAEYTNETRTNFNPLDQPTGVMDNGGDGPTYSIDNYSLCPQGYRIPILSEWEHFLTFVNPKNLTGLYATNLKLSRNSDGYMRYGARFPYANDNKQPAGTIYGNASIIRVEPGQRYDVAIRCIKDY